MGLNKGERVGSDRVPQIKHNHWLQFIAAALIAGAGLALPPLARPVVAAPEPITAAQGRQVARPAKGAGIAAAPPAGAQPSQALSFNTAMRWKRDAKTRTVFAVDDNRQLWFIEPSSGWPYTIDRRGVVYTANARTGTVYVVNTVAAWPGPQPYFFGYWRYSNGFYVVPDIDVYASLYLDAALTTVLYADTYNAIWDLNEAYFASEAFAADRIDLDPGGRLDAPGAALDSGSTDVDAAGAANTPQDGGGGGFAFEGGFESGGGGSGSGSGFDFGGGGFDFGGGE